MIARLVAACLLLAAGPALAQATEGGARAEGEAPSPAVFSVAARLGYGLPFGHWTGGTAETPSGMLTDVFSDIYPLQLDATYRLAQRLAAGVYVQVAPAPLQYRCVGGWCAARNFRAGALVMFRPPTGMKWSVFLTPELGYESSDFTARSEDDAFQMDVSYRGLDAALTVGADHPVGEKLRLGFFFFARAGTYLWLSVRMVREGFEVVPSPSLHGFLGFGARAEYAFF